MTRTAGFVLLLALAACHHTPPPQPVVMAPSAPPTYQDTTAAWAGIHHRDSTVAQPAVAPDTTQQWVAANLAIGEGVFIVRAHYGGRVYVGAGDASQAMTLQVDADAVDDFVNETRGFLPPKKPRRDAPQPVLEEPKSGRTMSFGRHVYGGQARYRFFFSDDRLGGFSLPATLTEARAILAGLTRGAAMAREAQSTRPQVSRP
jgi:hypothetical protein